MRAPANEMRATGERRTLDLGCGRHKLPGAIATMRTPHFSSVHSYTDPGHRQRLARGSMDQVRKELAPERTLEILRKDILFHDGPWSWPARLIYRISPNKYEKFFAFLFPARELVFELRVVKREE